MFLYALYVFVIDQYCYSWTELDPTISYKHSMFFKLEYCLILQSNELILAAWLLQNIHAVFHHLISIVH